MRAANGAPGDFRLPTDARVTLSFTVKLDSVSVQKGSHVRSELHIPNHGSGSSLARLVTPARESTVHPPNPARAEQPKSRASSRGGHYWPRTCSEQHRRRV